jgi:hypothetical protein
MSEPTPTSTRGVNELLMYNKDLKVIESHWKNVDYPYIILEDQDGKQYRVATMVDSY